MIAKAIGAACGLSLLVLIIYSAATHTLLQNALYIAGLLVLNLAVSFMPARLSKTLFFGEAKEGLRWFGRCINRVLVSAVLFCIYFLGVAMVWALSRIVGKRFLKLEGRGRSTWVDRRGQKLNFEEMF